MDDILFIVVMALVLAGLVLMCAALIQIKRQGGFEQAVAPASDGKWPAGRWLFGGALLCFALAVVLELWFD